MTLSITHKFGRVFENGLLTIASVESAVILSVAPNRNRGPDDQTRPQNWMDEEIAEGQLPDKRLDKRLRQVFDQRSVFSRASVPSVSMRRE